LTEEGASEGSNPEPDVAVHQFAMVHDVGSLKTRTTLLMNESIHEVSMSQLNSGGFGKWFDYR
jgi:hypothetical protein